ncbi:MAG: YfhO family protein [Candidatus Azobacteroides sp.]|nr:YfhO family protein [Candidatus Azobacteroides sp.]
MNKESWKKLIPYVAVLALFAVISLGYFTPEIFEGKVLFQHDTQQGIANSKEIKDFYEQTGERSRWTNSLFGGMPTYQISPSYDSTAFIRKVEKFYSLYLPSPAGLLFIMLLGFFILLKALKVRTSLAVMGAILYTFSSYFLILIKAGHIWKFITLAYIPPTIGGIILIYYRKKYWLGALVTTFFLALQIISNHVQMSYYFLFVILTFLIVYLIDAVKNKQIAGYLKASVYFFAAVLVAVGMNISTLYHTYEYSKETMRGKTELSHNKEVQTGNGLERDYIVNWSYGIGETWSLLVPNVKGGASGYLGNNEKAMESAQPQFRQTIAQMNQYWGNQPGTSGPVYVGAFVLFLFILGLFIVKGNLKWGLLVVSLLAILLSWGKNFMPFTDFFIDYFPMYNKFRAVSSILVIVEFTIPLLAILALKQIIEKPEIIKEHRKGFMISAALTAGVAFLFAVVPNLFFGFLSNMEKEHFLPRAEADVQFSAFLTNLEEIRRNLFTSDAWRSFAVILLGILCLELYAKKKVSSVVLIVSLTVITFLDLASVDKRYLSSEDFVAKRQVINPFPETVADKMIEQDKSLYYRVFNQTVAPFDDATTSYRHKSVGGYHAGKLRRYQDLINNQLQKGNIEVFNMLNTKYFIVPDQESQQPIAMQNPGAHGNAWFVDEIKWVNNADEEMAALDSFDALTTAVIDKQFEKELGKNRIAPKDSLSSITLVEYAPNRLVFQVNAKKEELAVFSDIYYPGWKATIDEKEIPIVRADYVLRALLVPAGEYTIEFTFYPSSVKTTEAIAYISLAVFLLGIIGYILQHLKNKKLLKKRENKQE